MLLKLYPHSVNCSENNLICWYCNWEKFVRKVKNSLIVKDCGSSVPNRAQLSLTHSFLISLTCGNPQFSVCKHPQGYILVELEEEEALILLDLNQHHFHKPQHHLWNWIQSLKQELFMILTSTLTEKLLSAWAQLFQISSQLSEIKPCMMKMVH